MTTIVLENCGVFQVTCLKGGFVRFAVQLPDVEKPSILILERRMAAKLLMELKLPKRWKIQGPWHFEDLHNPQAAGFEYVSWDDRTSMFGGWNTQRLPYDKRVAVIPTSIWYKQNFSGKDDSPEDLVTVSDLGLERRLSKIRKGESLLVWSTETLKLRTGSGSDSQFPPTVFAFNASQSAPHLVSMFRRNISVLNVNSRLWERGTRTKEMLEKLHRRRMPHLFPTGAVLRVAWEEPRHALTARMLWE